ncbi:class I SAM-dependent DNA methyltransferase [Paenibacillus glycinis]|uniref:Methyltransferase domain-containing protein n=1 Tax=Paenibacillus glycinis TaxID=2697035 RepID=A0ABW9XK14_9BACL|nr:class I SAM-dependent methyltransferase [Paenibacillus glycinis]NBD22908.1 methyltransferase domain-containing protein [Paenibacillus glycinis]
MEAYTQFAAVYDRLMADMPYPRWIAFAEACWQRYGKPATVVDLGCGTGSIALPLARSGYTVYGIDLSSDMLAVGRSKQGEAAGSGTVTWLQQDMTEWELGELADSVLSFCDCINYLTEDDDVLAAFAATYQGLKPGGLFLFDVHAPRTLRRYAEEQPFVLDEPDVAYIWTSELDEERMEIEHHLTIFADASGGRGDAFARIEEMHVQRAYDAEWIREALLATGFTRVDLFGDFELEPADDGTERLFFAAVK